MSLDENDIVKAKSDYNKIYKQSENVTVEFFNTCSSSITFQQDKNPGPGMLMHSLIGCYFGEDFGKSLDSLL